jgi:hypothetical protein
MTPTNIQLLQQCMRSSPEAVLHILHACSVFLQPLPAVQQHIQDAHQPMCSTQVGLSGASRGPQVGEGAAAGLEDRQTSSQAASCKYG